MKKIIKIISIVMLLFVGVGKAQIINKCQPFKQISINTGINAAGTNLPTTSGTFDPFWQLTNVAPPSVNGSGGILIPKAYTVPSGTVGSGGFPNWCEIPGVVTLNVIPSNTFGVNNLNPAQPWKFRRKFSIIASGVVTIAGSYVGDDQSELHICDPSGVILFTDNQAGWNVIKQFSKTLTVKPGCYFIEVELTNVGSGLMGFAVKANISSPTSIVANPSDACCNGSTISGQKWIDNNCDGILNTGDTPGVGWVFNLMSGSSTIQTATTDAYGQFYFNNVSPGSYTIAEVAQVGYFPKNPITGSQTITISPAVPVTLVTFLNCKEPQQSPCKCGQWGSTRYSINGTLGAFNCNGGLTTINANQYDIFSLMPSYNCTGSTVAQACIATFTYDVYFPGGTVLLGVKDIKKQKLDSCGDHRIVIHPVCGKDSCPPCEFILNVNCCQCAQDPKPVLGWITPDKINTLDLKCGETYTDRLECFKEYFIGLNASCGDKCEPDSIIYTIQPPVGSTLISYGNTFPLLTANQVGTYIVTIKYKCNGKWCEPCVIKFKQTKACDPPCNNCKDKVQADFDDASSTSVIKNYPSPTTLNTFINLAGGADTYTQVRVNVVDFQITSDNPACLQCYNNPSQWGGITGGSLAGFAGAVSSYPSVSPFNGNNNPREIIFTAPTPTTIPTVTALNLGFTIPGTNPLSCCCIKVVLFVKITYRNNKCEECSKIVRIGFKQCPTDGNNANGTPIGGTGTFDQTSGWPQFRQMHAPSNEDAQLLKKNPASSYDLINNKK